MIRNFLHDAQEKPATDSVVSFGKRRVGHGWTALVRWATVTAQRTQFTARVPRARERVGGGGGSIEEEREERAKASVMQRDYSLYCRRRT